MTYTGQCDPDSGQVTAYVLDSRRKGTSPGDRRSFQEMVTGSLDSILTESAGSKSVSSVLSLLKGRVQVSLGELEPQPLDIRAVYRDGELLQSPVDSAQQYLHRNGETVWYKVCPVSDDARGSS